MNITGSSLNKPEFVMYCLATVGLVDIISKQKRKLEKDILKSEPLTFNQFFSVSFLFFKEFCTDFLAGILTNSREYNNFKGIVFIPLQYIIRIF